MRTLPKSPMVRFKGRQSEMAAIGYYLKGGDYGDQFFVSDNGNKVNAEDILLADWANWRAILQRAKAQA